MTVLLDTQVVIAAYLGAKLPRRVEALFTDRSVERVLNLPVVTGDRQFRRYQGLKLIW